MPAETASRQSVFGFAKRLERRPAESLDLGVTFGEFGADPFDEGVDVSHPITAESEPESQIRQLLRAQLPRGKWPRRGVGRCRCHPLHATGSERHDREHHRRGEQDLEHEHHPAIVPREVRCEAELRHPITTKSTGGRSMRAGQRASGTLRLGSRTFGPKDLVIMAIINRTQDSFFDGGANWETDTALASVDRAIAEGADIVDIGGIKAAPGTEVPADEEAERVVPFIAAVRAKHPRIVISVDTWRAEVATAAIGAGADLVNDAWGGVDPGIAAAAAAGDAGLVCTHAGHLPPRTRPHRIGYEDVVADIVTTTVGLAERAVEAGVRPDGVLIDPGHDFGKNSRHSLEATRRLPELVSTGWPVLVAMSNKDFLGEVLDLPVTDRHEGTLAATAVAAWLGARVFRAHAVAATRRVLDTVAAIRGDRDLRIGRRGLA